MFKINVNNKQVKILLDNKNKADLINNILAYKFEIIIFKLEQSIFLHFENRKNAVCMSCFSKCKRLVNDDKNCNLFIFVEMKMIMKHVFVSVFNNFHVIQ